MSALGFSVLFMIVGLFSFNARHDGDFEDCGSCRLLVSHVNVWSAVFVIGGIVVFSVIPNFDFGPAWYGVAGVGLFVITVVLILQHRGHENLSLRMFFWIGMSCALAGLVMPVLIEQYHNSVVTPTQAWITLGSAAAALVAIYCLYRCDDDRNFFPAIGFFLIAFFLILFALATRPRFLPGTWDFLPIMILSSGLPIGILCLRQYWKKIISKLLPTGSFAS